MQVMRPFLNKYLNAFKNMHTPLGDTNDGIKDDQTSQTNIMICRGF